MNHRISARVSRHRTACAWVACAGLSLASAAVGCSSSSNDDGGSGAAGGAGTAGTPGAAGTPGTAGSTTTGSGGSTTTGSGGATSSGGSGTVGGSGAVTSTSGGANNGGSSNGGSGNGGGSNTGGGAGAGGYAGSGTGGKGGAAGGGSGGASGAAGAAGSGGMITMGKKFVGNITTNNAVRDGFSKYWDQITPENEGKWGSVQPSQGSFNWSALDKIHSYANTNHVIFKQHNFVWGSQQPSWVNSGNAQTAVQAWIKGFCDRYPDVKLIDVVNEPPPHTTPSYIDGIGGTGSSGYDWIVNAFKWARQSCPNAILILNDYNNIEYGNDNSHTIDIVNKIKAAGAPIDAVGCQAHDAYKIATNTVKGFIDKITMQTGLPVYITEYDIGIADDNMQKQVMQDQITMYWNDDNVKGITLWGYIVGSTWRANTGIQQPSGQMRPAMTWLMTFLGRPTT